MTGRETRGFLPRRASRYDHHGHVDVVEMAFRDKLRLAQHEFDLAPGDTPHALLDVDELLGRHGEKHDFARQLVGRLRVAEADCGAEHPGDLGVVPATMRRAGNRVGQRMFRGAQTVELADKGEPRSRGMSGKPALDPGESQPGARFEPQRGHVLGDKSGGFHLVEAGLGIAQNRFAEIDDRVGVTVNRLAHCAFQFILAVHLNSRLVKEDIAQSGRLGGPRSAESNRQFGVAATIAATPGSELVWGGWRLLTTQNSSRILKTNLMQ